ARERSTGRPAGIAELRLHGGGRLPSRRPRLADGRHDRLHHPAGARKRAAAEGPPGDAPDDDRSVGRRLRVRESDQTDRPHLSAGRGRCARRGQGLDLQAGRRLVPPRRSLAASATDLRSRDGPVATRSRPSRDRRGRRRHSRDVHGRAGSGGETARRCRGGDRQGPRQRAAGGRPQGACAPDRHGRGFGLLRLGHARRARDSPRDAGRARLDAVRRRFDGAEGAGRMHVRRGDGRFRRDRLDLEHAGAAPRRSGHDRHPRCGRHRAGCSCLGEQDPTDHTKGGGHMATAEEAPARRDGVGGAEAVAWYALSPDEVTRRLAVENASGLSGAEAASRLASVGPNKFTEVAVEPRWHAFVRQYRDPMQIVLLVAGIGSLYPLKELGTGLVLLFLTLFNAVLGLRQEGKAAEAVAALQKMMIVKARVRRGGELVQIPAEQLVPGDVVSIEAGDLLPADGRLLSVATLEVAESALTGESMPVSKGVEKVESVDTPLGDRTDIVYMNTNVTRGSGSFVVTSTGMSTEVGHISRMLQTTEDA